MTFEMEGIEKFNVGTIRKPKYEVYDLGGFREFEITSCAFSLKNSKTGTEVLSGYASYNNADVDIAGNTIKSVQPTLNLTGTDIEVGHYAMTFLVSLTNGESDILRIPVEIVDYTQG